MLISPYFFMIRVDNVPPIKADKPPKIIKTIDLFSNSGTTKLKIAKTIKIKNDVNKTCGLFSFLFI